MKNYFLALLSLLLIGCASPEEIAKKNCEDKIMASIMGNDFVKRSLKSPSTADFPSYSANKVSYNGNCTHTIRSYVDSQNGFGAMVRTNFMVKVRYNKSDETYSMVDLNIAN